MSDRADDTIAAPRAGRHACCPVGGREAVARRGKRHNSLVIPTLGCMPFALTEAARVGSSQHREGPAGADREVEHMKFRVGDTRHRDPLLCAVGREA